jgi:phosphoglycolate phosphatase
MRPKAYIFDFDGTLVHSNKLKREAFYSLSEEIIKNREAVDEVLSSIPESSRFEIIAKIYEIIGKTSGVVYTFEIIQKAIDTYTEVVRKGVLACPELEGATKLLSDLNSIGALIFISSNTPEEFLGEFINARNWDKLISDYHGFPKKKTETINSILSKTQFSSSDILVIGDGTSDEISAQQTGCKFYKITRDKSLLELYSLLYNQ